jgi:hypothetical protein
VTLRLISSGSEQCSKGSVPIDLSRRKTFYVVLKLLFYFTKQKEKKKPKEAEKDQMRETKQMQSKQNKQNKTKN